MRPTKLSFDALCINQDDENEKAKQVAKMEEILSRGGACAGWLAPSGDGSEELITISANWPGS
jgi:hypothetical protein